MEALEFILSWNWILIGGICSFFTLIFIVFSFFYQNRKGKSHKFKLSINKVQLIGQGVVIDYILENKSVNNIRVRGIVLEFLDAKNGINIPARLAGGDVFFDDILLFVGSRDLYSTTFKADDPSKMNERIDSFKLCVYSRHSNKPVSKVGKIDRGKKQN